MARRGGLQVGTPCGKVHAVAAATGVPGVFAAETETNFNGLTSRRYEIWEELQGARERTLTGTGGVFVHWNLLEKAARKSV